jgi:methionyl-tRNA formyltransferase
VALRLVYFGLPLGALLLAGDGHELALSVLSPAPAPGRRRLRRRATGPVLEAGELSDSRERELLSALQRDPPELLVSWFWSRRLPADWLHLPKFAAFGVHPSLLPRHRGPDPYFWAIDGGDLETGVSAHLLESSYDVGAVLASERLVVGDRNAWQLARALDRPSLRLLRRVVGQYAGGDVPVAIAQREEEATLAPEPSGAELAIDWSWPTTRVLRRIRALSPVPGLGLEIEGIRFQVTAARPAVTHVSSLEPGEAELSRDQGLTLKTVDGAFVVEQALFGDDEGAGAIGGHELVEQLCQRTGRSLLRGEVFAHPSESRALNQTGIDSATGGK